MTHYTRLAQKKESSRIPDSPTDNTLVKTEKLRTVSVDELLSLDLPPHQREQKILRLIRNKLLL